MRSLWKESEAKKFKNDPLRLRVYTSRLIGQEEDLVLHGGGNTSVKDYYKDIFGNKVEVLYVKGSGWDLATIEKEGFSPVRLDALKQMADLKKLTDSDMVSAQRAALMNPYAPNPSVEAILHAIIPYKYVDHTHTDAVVAISNIKNGRKRIEEIYGKRVMIIPYIMPGFILAREIYLMTKNIDWGQLDGLVLLNHGVFTFHDDAKTSYENMVKLVGKAENYLKKKNAFQAIPVANGKKVSVPNLNDIALLRKQVSDAAGFPMLVRIDQAREAASFASLKNVKSISTRGPLTPDHVITTKRIPLVISNKIKNDVNRYVENYKKYFDRNRSGKLNCLDPAPRWGVWLNKGICVFGKTVKDLKKLGDISSHTAQSIQWAEKLGGWKALPEKDIFDVEYWELEQAKLKKAGKPLGFQGKVALITGAASGIGKACVEEFISKGAVVIALDINPKIEKLFSNANVLPIKCDVTNFSSVKKAIEKIILNFGGIDILVSNAGAFTQGQNIEDLSAQLFEKSLNLNLKSHQVLLKECIPFLKNGIDPAVVIIASKNVPAPGPGASAYSVAKAGLTQLARVAALELGEFGIRVNVVHPNMVFDTSAWNGSVLSQRAKHYGMSVEDYKSNNVLRTDINSSHVAELVCTMTGPVFSKTTGAQVPIDGGNERVI